MECEDYREWSYELLRTFLVEEKHTYLANRFFK